MLTFSRQVESDLFEAVQQPEESSDVPEALVNRFSNYTEKVFVPDASFNVSVVSTEMEDDLETSKDLNRSGDDS